MNHPIQGGKCWHESRNDHKIIENLKKKKKKILSKKLRIIPF